MPFKYFSTWLIKQFWRKKLYKIQFQVTDVLATNVPLGISLLMTNILYNLCELYSLLWFALAISRTTPVTIAVCACRENEWRKENIRSFISWPQIKNVNSLSERIILYLIESINIYRMIIWTKISRYWTYECNSSSEAGREYAFGFYRALLVLILLENHIGAAWSGKIWSTRLE